MCIPLKPFFLCYSICFKFVCVLHSPYFHTLSASLSAGLKVFYGPRCQALPSREVALLAVTPILGKNLPWTRSARKCEKTSSCLWDAARSFEIKSLEYSSMLTYTVQFRYTEGVFVHLVSMLKYEIYFYLISNWSMVCTIKF